METKKIALFSFFFILFSVSFSANETKMLKNQNLSESNLTDTNPIRTIIALMKGIREVINVTGLNSTVLNELNDGFSNSTETKKLLIDLNGTILNFQFLENKSEVIDFSVYFRDGNISEIKFDSDIKAGKTKDNILIKLDVAAIEENFDDWTSILSSEKKDPIKIVIVLVKSNFMFMRMLIFDEISLKPMSAVFKLVPIFRFLMSFIGIFKGI